MYAARYIYLPLPFSSKKYSLFLLAISFYISVPFPLVPVSETQRWMISFRLGLLLASFVCIKNFHFFHFGSRTYFYRTPISFLEELRPRQFAECNPGYVNSL